MFLQRFTLDRAYGQDVEISIPKSKDKKKKQGASSGGNTADPNHPMNVETRRQTKMAAHVSMEVVKLLRQVERYFTPLFPLSVGLSINSIFFISNRSGNLRVNLMRTAQGAMSKLKLPIKKAKKQKTTAGPSSSSSKGKKDKGKNKA